MNTATADDPRIRAFMQAASDVLEVAIAQAGREDPAALDGLRAMLKAGGSVALAATIAPSTGLAMLAVDAIEPDGVRHQLMMCELHRMVRQ